MIIKEIIKGMKDIKRETSNKIYLFKLLWYERLIGALLNDN